MFLVDSWSSLQSANVVKLHRIHMLYKKLYSTQFSHLQYHYSFLSTHFSSRADSAKMTQPMRGDQAHQPAPARKSASLSSPSAARRLYRNLSGKFRVGNNPPALEDNVVSGRGGEKERLRKTTIVSWRERVGKNNKPRNIVV